MARKKRGPGRPRKKRGPGRPPIKRPGKRGRKPLFTDDQKRALDRMIRRAVAEGLRRMARAAAKVR